MQQFPQAAQGLRYVLYGFLLREVSGLCLLLFSPVVYYLLWFVGTGIIVYGLQKGTQEDEGYRYALYATLIHGIAMLIGIYVWAVLMNAVALVMSMVEIYYICTTTADLLQQRDLPLLAQKGNKLWLGCSIFLAVCFVCTVALLGHLVTMVAMVVTLVSSIAYLVCYIQFLMFLYRSSKVL